MKDVLYIGPYRQNDTWGYYSKSVATLLSNMDVNLALRPIWFTAAERAADIENLKQYEDVRLEHFDILIQHGLPSSLSYNGRFKTNMAITKIDCNIFNIGWHETLGLFDQVIVLSEIEKQILLDSGAKYPVQNLFCCPPTLTTAQDFEFDVEGTTFYTRGSLDLLSGLRETLAAYLSEFTILDNVCLIIATDQEQRTQQLIEGLKNSLNIYTNKQHYPAIAVINQDNRHVMSAIHQKFTYFINMSYNSGLCEDTALAIVNNSTPIVIDTCNIAKDYCFAVDSITETMLHDQRPLPNLFSGEFTWKKPSIASLKNKLRLAYTQETSDQLKEQLYMLKNKIFSTPHKQLQCILTQ